MARATGSGGGASLLVVLLRGDTGLPACSALVVPVRARASAAAGSATADSAAVSVAGSVVVAGGVAGMLESAAVTASVIVGTGAAVLGSLVAAGAAPCMRAAKPVRFSENAIHILMPCSRFLLCRSLCAVAGLTANDRCGRVWSHKDGDQLTMHTIISMRTFWIHVPTSATMGECFRSEHCSRSMRICDCY